MSAVTGRVFVAQNPEQFTYDADGNMTSDGRFRYTWNGENRLVRAQELVAPTNRNPYTVAYAYDHKGRMVSKRITENDGNDTLVKSIAYLWDGWNIIRETQWPVTSDQWSAGPLATNHYPLVTDYVWGLDLDGTMQGAGGVGGLLAVQRSDCTATNSSLVTRHSSLYFPTYDANGNISEYIDESGEVVAHYDYSPFGETLIESGDLASSFTHRFSTKPWCPVTGLYEYQMRKYRPEIGRWLSRDPVKTTSSLLCCYSYVDNAPNNQIDYLGFVKIWYNSYGKEICRSEKWVFWKQHKYIEESSGSISFANLKFWPVSSIENSYLPGSYSGTVHPNWDQEMKAFVTSNNGINYEAPSWYKQKMPSWLKSFNLVMRNSPSGATWDYKRTLSPSDWYIYKGMAYRYDSIGNITWGAIMKSYGWPEQVSKIGAGLYQIYSDFRAKTFDEEQFVKRLLQGSYGDDPRDQKAIAIGYQFKN